MNTLKQMQIGKFNSVCRFKTCQGFPASLGLEHEDVQTYSDWGVDYLKYDNCYTDHGSPQSRYYEMATAIQSLTTAQVQWLLSTHIDSIITMTFVQGSNEIFYSLCEWGRENPAAWAPKIGANSWRVSGDIRDSWSSIVTRADIAAPLWRYSGPSTGWNDPDMLEVGNGKCNEVCTYTQKTLYCPLTFLCWVN